MVKCDRTDCIMNNEEICEEPPGLKLTKDGGCEERAWKWWDGLEWKGSG